MKVLLVIFIMITSGGLAYSYKQRFKIKLRIVRQLIDYIDFYKMNITFYKEDLYKINNKYNIMRKNKNANNSILILKNNLFVLDYEKINNMFKKEEIEHFDKYLKNIGMQDYQIELDKCVNFSNYLLKTKEEISYELKNKGEMWFKIIVLMGAVISIVIW